MPSGKFSGGNPSSPISLSKGRGGLVVGALVSPSPRGDLVGPGDGAKDTNGVDDQMKSESCPQPDPRVQSANNSSEVHTRAPILAHMDKAC